MFNWFRSEQPIADTRAEDVAYWERTVSWSEDALRETREIAQSEIDAAEELLQGDVLWEYVRNQLEEKHAFDVTYAVTRVLSTRRSLANARARMQDN